MFTNQKDLSEINTSLPGSFDKPNNTTNTSIGYCVFNEDSPATHCDTIYNSYFYGYFEQSYVHCGKSYSDNCTIDDECSSEYCNTHCILNSKEPSYDSAKSIINPIIILIIISIYIWLCCTCLCYSTKYRKLSEWIIQLKNIINCQSELFN